MPNFRPPKLSLFVNHDDDVNSLPDSVIVRFRQTAEDAARFARRLDMNTMADRYEATAEHLRSLEDDRRYVIYEARRKRDELRAGVVSPLAGV